VLGRLLGAAVDVAAALAATVPAGAYLLVAVLVALKKNRFFKNSLFAGNPVAGVLLIISNL